MDSIEKRVAAIVAEELGFPPGHVSPGMNLARDLGADSVNNLELAMATEDEFGIQIGDDHVDRWKTVADIVATVRSMVPA